MRIFGALCTFALFLFLIVPAPGYAQDRDDSKPQEQAKPEDNNKPKDNDKAKENNKGKQEDRSAKPDDKRNEAPTAGRQDEHQNQPEANRPQEQRNQGREQRPAEQQRPMDNEHRAAQGNDRDRNHNAGNRGRRIPDDQFRSHFGREHRFHVQRERIVNVSQPVVVYGGYSFQLVDAWPSDWSYDDDCYIDYIDGEYFMFDVLHPGIRIAVFVIE
jgi:hypothetical protein